MGIPKQKETETGKQKVKPKHWDSEMGELMVTQMGKLMDLQKHLEIVKDLY